MTNQQRPLPSNKRQAIIDAAYHVLAGQGYEATSIKEIAKVAGVAPGLVHYYFASKEDLLIAVLKHTSERYTQDVQALSNAVPEDELLDAALLEPKQRVSQEPERYQMRYELFALAMRNPAMAKGVAEIMASGREGILRVVQLLITEQDEHMQAGIAALLLSLFDGLALQKLVDPTFDLESAYEALKRLLASLLNPR